MTTIVRDNRTLFERYDSLRPNDIVLGRIRLRQSEEHVFTDLLERGIILIPSARSQLCSRSKVFQARLLQRYMVPGTEVVYDRHDMMHIVTEYGKEKTGTVVCKLDRANGGQGILKFQDVEDVFSQTVLGGLGFPFVIQPFLADCQDIRVVMLGSVIEAYRRSNPDNFRQNLHCGGSSISYSLTHEQIDLCKQIMQRADFPYGHIDLLITDEGHTWLSEINLRGGLRGAVLTQQDYLETVGAIHERLLIETLKRIEQ